MPTSEPVNTQQVLQMATHAEKLQQTTQQQSQTLVQQLENERLKSAELKSIEIQDPDNPNPGNMINSDRKMPRRSLRRRRTINSIEIDDEIIDKNVSSIIDKSQGNNINIVI